MRQRKQHSWIRPIAAVVVALALDSTRIEAAAKDTQWFAVGPQGGGPQFVVAGAGNPQSLYGAFPAGPYGGLETVILRSTNGGRRWTNANRGLEGERVIALGIDPGNSRRLFAVAAVQGCFSDDPGGIYRSEDAGSTWELLRRTDQVGGIACESSVLVLDRAVLVGTNEGVIESTDHGATWTRINFPVKPDAVHTLAQDPSDPDTVYAVGWYARYVTHDAGASWSRIDDPFPATPPPITAFAIAPSAPERLYEISFDAMARSDDGGATWQSLPGPNFSQQLEGGLLAVDPHDPDILFVAGATGLLRSRDGGTTFRRLRDPLLPSGDSNVLNHLTTDGAGRLLLSTTRDLLSSVDSGDHWAAQPLLGVHANPIRLLRVDSRQHPGVLFQSFDALFAGRDGGTRFERLVPLAQLRDLVIDPFDPLRVLALVGGTNAGRGIMTSDNPAQQWTLETTLPFAASSIAVPEQGALLATSGNHIYRRDDPLGAWRRVLTAPSEGDDRNFFSFTALCAHPTAPDHLVAIGYQFVLHVGNIPELFQSADGGRHWRAAPAGRDVVAFDAERSDRFATTRGSEIVEVLFARPSVRRIATLRPADQVTAISYGPPGTRTLFVATGSHGILETELGSGIWNGASRGLPLDGKDPVTAFAFDPTRDHRLYATASGGGLWAFDVPAGIDR